MRPVINSIHAMFFAWMLVALPPWHAIMPTDGIDPSWMLVVSHAYNQGWQFGKDIVFTTGPYGVLYSRLYDPNTCVLMLVFWSLLAMLVALSSRYIAPVSDPIANAVGFATLGVASCVTPDVPLYLVPLLLLLVYIAPPSRVGRVLALLLIGMTAWVGLLKFPLSLLGLATVVLIEAHRVATRRWIPYCALLYAGSSLVLFRLAGQNLENYPAYVRGSLMVTSGYSEAMSLTGPVWEILLFLGIAACGLGTVSYAAWQQRRTNLGSGKGWLLVAGFTAWIVLVFKHGFVRQDGHSLVAWATLSVTAAACSMFILRKPVSAPIRASLITLCVASTVLTLARADKFIAHEPLTHIGRSALHNAEWVVNMFRGDYRSRQDARLAEALDRIRANHPVPRVSGTVDIYPLDQAAVIAQGLDYLPRPVFQSITVYTEGLIDVNRKHLGSDRSASTLFFDVKTIDDRFPALDEGRLWPDILERYDPARMANGYLVLTKRSTRRPVQIVPGAAADTTWLVPLELPRSDAPVWASIRIEQTLLGRLLNALFKLPQVFLVAMLDDGTERRYRVVPAMAREGFVLSPVIETAEDFARLYREKDASNPKPLRVLKIAVTGDTGVRWAYRDRIEVRFSDLCVERCASR